MANWIITICKHTEGNVFGVTREQSRAVILLYRHADEVQPDIHTAVANHDLIQFTYSRSPVSLEKTLGGDSMVRFTNVEGEPVGGSKRIVFGRCSRTFTLLREANSLCCTSCGRHASKESFKYEWLGFRNACGVCGCICI